MHSARLLQALAVALSTFAAAHASLADSNAGAIAFVEVVKRQADSSTGGGGGSSRSTTSDTSKTSTTTSPSRTTTSPSTTPSTSSRTSSTPTTGDTSTPPPTTSDTSASNTPSVVTSTTVVTTTGADGQPSTFTSSSISTQSSSLANNGSNSAPSGMDEKTRNVIIGVVVGVGGAIILGVVGLFAWRIWGRKKQQEEAENFGNAYAPADKVAEPTGSTNSRTPFQSTLESYHAPTQVNASSNF